MKLAHVLSLFAVASAASTQQTSVLTIEDAVALALKANRQVQSSVLGADAARRSRSGKRSATPSR
jgi:hypothetical protein